MKLNQLRKVRIIVSMLAFALLLLFFLDIHNAFTDYASKVILRLQFFPSLLRFSALFFSVTSIGFLLVLGFTFLFGRVYCSSLCPLGTLQDVVIAFSRIFKSRRKRRFVFSPNRKLILRYSILALTLIFWAFGSLFLINLLDPYSNFGKIAVTLFQPLFSWVNNTISFGLERFEVYSVAPVMAKKLPADVIAVSVGIFTVVAVMSVWRGRLFCNTLCPVGSVLSLASQNSVYRIAFNEESCNLCGKCERVCKAECIDSKAKKVDMGRCINCFNCFSSCANNGLTYKKTALQKTSVAKISPQHNTDTKKRSFLLTLLIGLFSLPMFRKLNYAQGESKPGMIPSGTKLPVTPPGSLSYENFTGKCIACYLCVSTCPKNVIVPSFFDYGFDGFMQPKLDYHKSFCNFDCVKCTDVCPTGAIRKLDVASKHTTQIGIAKFLVESCIVTVEKTDCGACSEHCPTKAVNMVPYNGLWLPEVEPDLCVGCGACEYACPTEPYKAIFVESNKTHQLAIPIAHDEGPRDHDQDEFPF